MHDLKLGRVDRCAGQNHDKMLLESVVCSDTLSSLSGGTGETAAAGKPHSGGLRQCKNRQERQLLKICKTAPEKKPICFLK